MGNNKITINLDKRVEIGSEETPENISFHRDEDMGFLVLVIPDDTKFVAQTKRMQAVVQTHWVGLGHNENGQPLWGSIFIGVKNKDT